MYFKSFFEEVQLCRGYARNYSCYSSIVGCQKHCSDHCHGSLGTTQLVFGSLLLGCLHVKGVLLVMIHEVYLCLKDLPVDLRAFYFSLVPRRGGGGGGERAPGTHCLHMHVIIAKAMCQN